MIKSIGQKVTKMIVSFQAHFFYFDKGFVYCLACFKKWFNCGVENEQL